MSKSTCFLRRVLAFVLAAAMLFSLAACAKAPVEDEPLLQGSVSESTVSEKESTPQSGSPAADTESVQPSAEEEEPAVVPAEYDRESMEQIVEVLGGGSERVSDMDDEELDKLVEDLIENMENQEKEKIENLNGQADRPVTEVIPDEDVYDENGAMNEPFDQVYPELVENGDVTYDDETLLVKMSNSYGGAVTGGMAAAGIAALECIVPMEETSWYEAKLVAGTDAQQTLSALRQLPEILLAEYNYEVQTAQIDQYKDWYGDRDYDNNEYHDDQWHMHHCGIPDGYEAMKTDGGSSSVVVAVIDTGVDYDHEDLAQNIWVNSDEIPDDGIDNDGNGYVDDYYGVDIVAGSGSGDDDNGHGTHVAGIIAAQNNNLGTVGIAYNVKIMPIKAAMASGYLHQSDIAKAVLYAYENGAEVINMSFGGTACSIAVQDALAVAYTRCVLVASAGNDGAPNEGLFAIPNYPAALTYVLGVMSVDESGRESAFTNYDVQAFNGVEYELYAPGSNIMSTLPGNRYGILSGTSMAAPVVSAMAAILRSEFSDRDMYPTKFIYGQLASTSNYTATCLNPNAHGVHNLPQIVDLNAALTKLPVPEVNMQDYALFDTEGLAQDEAGVNSGEGVIDAGETIALGLTLRNRWGMSENTIVKLDTLSLAGVADPYITILNDTVNYDSVGTYSTQDCGRIYTNGIITGWENPFYIRIAENCPNDYIFRLNVTITCGNALNTADTASYTTYGTIELEVRNGTVVPSVISEDTVWTADNLYIIPNGTIIEEGVTVRVEPGTNIQFWSNDEDDPYADNYIAYLRVDGNFFVDGTKENPVYIYPSDLMSQYVVDFGASNTGTVVLKYADITNYNNFDPASRTGAITAAYGCTFRKNYEGEMARRRLENGVVKDDTWLINLYFNIGQAENCAFYKIGVPYTQADISGEFKGCIFVDSKFNFMYSTSFENCVFLGNYFDVQTDSGAAGNSSYIAYPVHMDWSPDNLELYYCPETGSTYLGYIRSSQGSMVIREAVQALGGDYAVVETEEENKYLMELIPNHRAILGLTFDFQKDQYVWADGSELPEFLQVPGLTDTLQNQELYYREGRLDFHSNFTHQYGNKEIYLFEIPGEVYLTDFTLPEYELLLDMESSYQLRVSSEPVNVPAEELIFESKDETVAKVDASGRITPVGEGTADIYIYSADKALSNYVTVTVRDYVALETITFPVESVELAVGEQRNVTCQLKPVDTTRREVTYTSSNPAVATVDEYGNIKAVGSGETVITATSTEQDGTGQPITAQMIVTAFRKATALDISKSTLSLAVGGESLALPEVITSEGAEVELVWESTDTEVLTLMDGLLVPGKIGTSSLIVTDQRSGLSDSVLVYVTDGTQTRIKDFYSGDEAAYALLENGDLYGWKNGHMPKLLQSNVRSITGESLNCWAVGEDNRVMFYNNVTNSYEDNPQLPGVTLKAMIGYVSSYFAITDTGYVYTWGYNQYGMLGVGHNSDVDSGAPELVNLENVVDVYIGYSAAWFLTADGKLYLSGGSELQSNIPVLMAENVENMVGHYDSVQFLSNGSVYRQDGNGNAPYWMYDTAALAGYDFYTYNGYRLLAVKDGQLYKVAFSPDTTVTKIEGVEDIIDVWSDLNENTFYAATALGMVYRLDNSTVSAVSLYTMDGDHVVCTGTNLEENVLKEDSLKLTFNKSLNSASVHVYEDGAQVPVSVSIQHNVVTVSRSAGFTAGTSYEVEILASGLSGMANTTLTEDLHIIFTGSGAVAEAPDTGDSDTGIVTPEEVIHEDVLDETVERFYWTEESLAETLQETAQQQNLHPEFVGNVILNRFSTDTDVTHWLRIQGAEGSGEIPLGGNYWGTTSENVIGMQIIDYADFPNYAKIDYSGYLTEAPENTFPFVTGIAIINKAGQQVWNVGNEEITVYVYFNRDMDTSIPLMVRFGSAYPYGDYEITGNFVNARTWAGTYTLSTVIENGYQLFTISNGCSAVGGLDLFADTGRFGFEIDTTAAQALIMQGSATDTGIQLKWTQDDFDTLMGYNVYRSTSEDGYYQRLNSTVVPAEQMEFFDDTVEPGVQYYYNFTVVKTDLTESTPSGKITIMSRDTMAPNIYHSPVYNATTGQNLIISATVTDNLNIVYTNVYYRTAGTANWKMVRMNNLNAKYSAIIPAYDVTIDGIEYYLEAFDGVSYTYKGSATAPYTIMVQEAVDKNALGDVNNDGVITNYDALLVLYAINDQYNLTAEEFARADLNGDGQLWAAEALRILQYVSGAVGSVIMP